MKHHQMVPFKNQKLRVLWLLQPTVSIFLDMQQGKESNKIYNILLILCNKNDLAFKYYMIWTSWYAHQVERLWLYRRKRPWITMKTFVLHCTLFSILFVLVVKIIFNTQIVDIKMLKSVWFVWTQILCKWITSKIFWLCF